MKLSGLHLLLTYQCNLECDHCFVWGSPWQNGTMTLKNIRQILKQGRTRVFVEAYRSYSADGLFTSRRRKPAENAAHRARSVARQQKGHLWMETN